MYFKNIKSFEDLKEQFRNLAREHHPDAGGDAEVMKEINMEFDQLFPIWKHRHNQSAAEASTETADSTRTEFYTQSGWKGSKHDWNRSTKEVAACIRAYVKEIYPTYKFSVRFSTASMCSEIHVDLVNSPSEIYKKFDELSQEEVSNVWLKALRNFCIKNKSSVLDDDVMAELKEVYDKRDNKFLLVYTEVAQAVIDDVDREVRSYNFEDCDGMIDYFDVDFYYFGCGISDKFQVIEKTARIKNKRETTMPATTATTSEPSVTEEYDIKKDVHTKTQEPIFVVKVLRTLTKEEYINVSNKMKSLGGYYSKFKHGFIFKEDPTGLLAA